MRKYERKTNRPKRGKHRGSLELRGKVYFARWMVNGQRFSETTGETKRAAAEKWLERKLANVHATDIRAKGKRQIETLLQQKAAQLKGAIVQAEEAQEAALHPGSKEYSQTKSRQAPAQQLISSAHKNTPCINVCRGCSVFNRPNRPCGPRHFQKALYRFRSK